MIDNLQARLRRVLARLLRQRRGMNPFRARPRDVQKFECKPVVDCDPLRLLVRFPAAISLSVITRDRGAVFRQPENDAVEGVAEHGLIRNVQTCLCSQFVRRWRPEHALGI